jgi:hypothetical protein
MRARCTRSFGFLLASVIFVASTTGCTPPGLYTSAFPHKGYPQPTLVVEPVSWLSSPNQPSDGQRGFGDVHLRLRVELPKSCDIGFMLGAIRAGTDVKCTVWQTDEQAVAVDGGALASLVDLGSTKASFWLNSAVLYSWRHALGIAVTLNSGFSYWLRNDQTFKVEFMSQARSLDAQGPYVRAGVSLETPGWFSLQPEFNVFQQVSSGSLVTFMTFGIGMHLNHVTGREVPQVKSQSVD